MYFKVNFVTLYIIEFFFIIKKKVTKKVGSHKNSIKLQFKLNQICEAIHYLLYKKSFAFIK